MIQHNRNNHNDDNAHNERDNRDGCPVAQLAWYANGTLSQQERVAIEAHLAGCASCRAEVGAWSELRHAMRRVSEKTPEPQPDLFARVERQLGMLPSPPSPPPSLALSSAHAPERGEFPRLLWARQAWQAWQAGLLALSVCGEHFRAQARLIRRDLFWMPLLLVPLAGWIIYVLRSGRPESSTMSVTVPETASLMAALLTALSMAFLYGQEVDPAREMVLATRTPPGLVLGVRCCLVFGYDLILNCGVVLPLLAWQGIVTPGWFLTNWLAPLCCLSAITLLLSIVLNPATAVVVSILLWAVRFLDSMQIFGEMPWQRYYEGFWRQGSVLFVVAILSVLLAFGLFERKERFA